MRGSDPFVAEDAFRDLEADAAHYVSELLEAFRLERDRPGGIGPWLLELLGASKSPRAVPLLESLLSHPDDSYVYWARWGLGEIDTEEARAAPASHPPRDTHSH